MLFTVLIALCLSFVRAQNVSLEYDPYSVSARCPFACNADRSTWAAYHDLVELEPCNKTLLLELNVYYKVEGLESLFAMRGCAIGGQPALEFTKRQTLVVSNATTNNNISTSSFDIRNQTTDIEITRYGGGMNIQSTTGGALANNDNIQAAAMALAEHLTPSTAGSSTTLFAKSGKAILGLYAGSQIDLDNVGAIIREFTARATSSKSSLTQMVAQSCHEGSLDSQIFGIYLDIEGNLGAVRDAIRDWRDANCVKKEQGDSDHEIWYKAPLGTIPGSLLPVGPKLSARANLHKRATCSYTQVQSGDGCWALADRCKISQDQLKQYNSDRSNLCDSNSLQPGQYVCCSSGTLPDFSPQPNSDGSCKTTTMNGDFCGVTAQKNQMTVAQIEERNKNTWGWAGCNYLQLGQVYCLSTGAPPMPAPLSNAVCGPQVPNTPKPAGSVELASLNPCPLRACCNVWGQCGTTKDFCIKSPADTGAPGTTKPGANSCVYNCGMDVVNNGSPPSTFIKLGYFEAFNPQRPCLHMRPGQISGYTHVQYAFGGITSNFEVTMAGQETIFAEFKALSGVKKIMSFGGWSFSTEADTFPIFRQGVTASQRDSFARNVVKFLNDNNLDGLDFDWEYPGAPDIPGIPPGNKDDGANYLEFLKLVRQYMPSGKTLSIAAPASFWYLKGFPIEDMAKLLDYIVYMTYDIHGQWDYGNKFTSEGCPNGDCLRSHVNRTETLNAMSMITKAGVSANKILIGMALYGRTFKMVDPGCRTENCKFTGPSSGADPGRCTGTRGYLSNFEIREIQSSGSAIQEWTNQEGDYMIFNNDNWVSWMTKATYARRLNWVKLLNFGGTADWAIDLDADYAPGDGAGGGDSGSGAVLIDPSIYTSQTPTVRCYPQCTFVFPPMVLPTPTTIVIPPETVTFEERWTTTSSVSGAIITETAARITSTVITVPPVVTSEIEIWNMIWTGSTKPSATYGTINLTMSVSVPPATFTYTNEVHPTPITWTYSPGPWPPLPPSPTGPDRPGQTPSPPGPPPGPPPGFPLSVNVEIGTPGPICRSRCGKPCRKNCDPGSTRCRGICGCLGCPDPPCLGVGCFDSGGGGGGGGGGGNPNDPSSCRTRTTVSTCLVMCSELRYPNIRTRTCKDPDCSGTRTACTATGTTTTTTTTLSCSAEAPYPSYNPNQQVPMIGDGGLGGVVEAGEFTSMSQRPSTSRPALSTSAGSAPIRPSNSVPIRPSSSAPIRPSSSAPKPPNTTSQNGGGGGGGGGAQPTPTVPTIGPTPTPGNIHPLCFRNFGNQYHSFSEEAARGVVRSLCSTGDVLPPSNNFGFAVRGADGLYASVTWASNQNGCPPKRNVPLRDFCFQTLFNVIILNCDGVDQGPLWGGAFVEKSPDAGFGCVRWEIGADNSNSVQSLDFVETEPMLVTDPAAQQVIRERLDQLEPSMPVIVRSG